jgi:hypothetical protein
MQLEHKMVILVEAHHLQARQLLQVVVVEVKE